MHAPEQRHADERTRRIGTLPIVFDDSVLEPRPWTVAQAEWAAELSRGLPDGPILELCTGAGHIGLVAAHLTGRAAVLVDASAAACRLARYNADSVATRVEVRQGSIGSVLGPEERFPLVLADPPYIPSGETSTFPDDPLTAIDGGADGLDAARECLHVAGRHLTRAGALVLQLRNPGQLDGLDRTLDEGQLTVREVRDLPRGTLVHLAPLEG